MIKYVLISLLLLSSHSSWAETPPPAEYPYPEQPVSTEAEVEQPIAKDERGGFIYSTDQKRSSKQPYRGVEQPVEVGEDGSYYYTTDDDDSKPQAKAYQGVEQPIETDSRGGFYYDTDMEKPEPKTTYGPKPSKVTENGEYFYDLAKKETTNTLYIRGGIASPPNIKPVIDGGLGFKDVYGNSSSFMFNIEYDWKLWRGIFLKISSGITTTTGRGQFSGNPDVTPREEFTFYTFPNTVNFTYKFQLWDIQYLTPYVEGGPGYFTFIENRSDGQKTKLGGAPVLAAGAGLLISLTKFTHGTTLYSDYGITQSWFDLQFRQIVGLDARKDFTSNIITGGFAVGF